MNEMLPEARRIKRRLPGLIWAVPAAALIIVGYLGVNAMLERGVEVIITFDDAAGAKPRDTVVTYKGLTIGKVTHIELADDGERVEMTVRLSRKVEPLLTTGTRFWLVGANPTFSDIASLTAAVTGLSIEMAPGQGEPIRRFSGLGSRPIVLPGTPGRAIVLTTEQRGSLKPGSRVSYRGDDAGKVTGVRFVAPATFEVEAFVYEPFSALLRDDSMFWVSGGMQVQLSAQGVTTNLPTATDWLAGSVTFITPESAIDKPASVDGARFRLYVDEMSARDGVDGADVLYEANFTAATGALNAGAPVTLLGFRVGRVRSRALVVDAATGAVSNPVVLALHPRRLGFDENERATTDTLVRQLVERGYKLRLVQSPPIVGSLGIELVKDDARGKVDTGTAYPRLPTTSSDDLASLTSSISSILAKVDRVPFEAIGENVNASAEHLNRALAAAEPEIGPLMANLRATSQQVQSTAASASAIMTGDGAPQDSSLPGAIRQLTDAARSIRAFTDYIERHPEALLFGKPKEK